VRSVAFVLHGMSLSFNKLMYFVLPKVVAYYFKKMTILPFLKPFYIGLLIYCFSEVLGTKQAS
jgi:hypothetical protein